MISALTVFSIFNPHNPGLALVRAEQVENENITDEALIPYSYENWHDFTYESVIIVLKRDYSELNKKWSMDDFSVNNISAIEDLTYMDFSEKEQKEYLEKVDFHQILRIYLENQSIDAVLNAIEEFENCDCILSAEPNFNVTYDIIPNDTSIPSNYYAFGNTYLYDAWNITTGSSSVKVGIIDSGIANVTDLSANVDYSLGYDFYNDNSTTWDDTFGHGTCVASVVGAVGNNSTGSCGVCWNIKLVPLQVLGGGVAEWIEAVSYAETYNIPILNLSASLPEQMNALKSEIDNYTGLFICTAGNTGANIDDGINTRYPACLTNSNLITVAASKSDDELADFSCYGATSVDLAAPGDDIMVIHNNGSCYTEDGTSVACPMVSGTAALLLSRNPNLTSLEIKEAILNSVDQISSYNGKILSKGRLNVLKALQYVKPANQVQNIVVKVDKNNSSPLNYLNFRITYDKKYQEYVSTVNGNITPTGITLNGADLLKWKLYLYYSGNNLYNIGNLFTCRFKTNVNSKKSIFENSTSINNSYNLDYTIAVIGDINDDGFVNTTDKNLVQDYLLNLVTFDSRQMISADVNFDGNITMSDAIIIAQYNAGSINSFF